MGRKKTHFFLLFEKKMIIWLESRNKAGFYQRTTRIINKIIIKKGHKRCDEIFLCHIVWLTIIFVVTKFSHLVNSFHLWLSHRFWGCSVYKQLQRKKCICTHCTHWLPVKISVNVCQTFCKKENHLCVDNSMPLQHRNNRMTHIPPKKKIFSNIQVIMPL